LKQHLLPQILLKLRSSQLEQSTGDDGIPLASDDIDPNSVLFKHDRLYQHSIMRINYTTYDVRRSQDVISMSTPRRDIMVLADSGDCNSVQPFRYARVLGIFHVNAIYVGPGMVNYQPHRLEFLWVRWYRNIGTIGTGWQARKLDRIQFPSLSEDDSFGFLDPSNVLRGCHVVPAFAKRKLHSDNRGLSHCAQDASDWVEYYVNR
jgi:hypothetical protein